MFADNKTIDLQHDSTSFKYIVFSVMSILWCILRSPTFCTAKGNPSMSFHPRSNSMEL